MVPLFKYKENSLLRTRGKEVHIRVVKRTDQRQHREGVTRVKPNTPDHQKLHPLVWVKFGGGLGIPCYF